MNDKKIGKTLKVFSNELTFGKNDRLVNIFGAFKYKKNTTNYIVYADTNEKYNIVYYATAHIKDDSVLTLDAKKVEDTNAIKEYIFKVTNSESLSDYEMFNLDKINYIEIIGYSKLEIKPEVFSKLVELTIPKPEQKEKPKENTKKKTSPLKALLIIIILLCIGIGGYIFFTSKPTSEAITKSITCTKNYNHEDLEAVVYEEKKFNFNNRDTLENVDNIESFVFNTPEDYSDFVNRGLYFNYRPDDEVNGGYSLDDDNNTYKIITKDNVDESYNEPIDYEEVLSYYKAEGYICEESINQ